VITSSTELLQTKMAPTLSKQRGHSESGTPSNRVVGVAKIGPNRVHFDPGFGFVRAAETPGVDGSSPCAVSRRRWMWRSR